MKEYKVKVNGNEYKVEIEEVGGTITNVSAAPVQAAPQTSAPRPAAASAPAAAGGTKVTSPLPGVILDVAVKEGDSVKKGDKVVVLEAMKMENVIEATADGVVKEIKVKKSDSVLEGDVLVVIG
ncbi:MAG: biotin/lipoyl-binding protein [Bacteroidales bacterium]|jgi:biotin carboxyl carrier protein|nr:biotin/lipoyl-binding protein [Bacteroidales bacterium]MBQ1882509.1 biotin/lipoyl-binding protein [Bacteroidales bacterium]MBQ2482875.1 biotin/lipoyl-binding protein [Bacteroidales bacterium]MBQ2493413.1 biotin/lipoyl-binding protein [Bacteroidales bacterium]MBQ4197037.1 biotin/lipoyl-binding protein [Bacteroidales bacterium]